jgi:sensor c-di-GMP phosphodiesterase-like protein
MQLHGPNFPKPPLDIIEDNEEWEVKEIIGERVHRAWKKTQFRVQWKAWFAVHDTWEPEENVHGNIDEHYQALINAQPWMTGNNVTLAWIVTAIPALQLHLVQNITYMRQAWESLRAFYQPHNSLWAASIKGQIMTYCCMSDMYVTNWLNNMQCLYNLLYDLKTDHMSNCEFTLTILNLMLQDNG